MKKDRIDGSAEEVDVGEDLQVGGMQDWKDGEEEDACQKGCRRGGQATRLEACRAGAELGGKLFSVRATATCATL